MSKSPSWNLFARSCLRLASITVIAVISLRKSAKEWNLVIDFDQYLLRNLGLVSVVFENRSFPAPIWRPGRLVRELYDQQRGAVISF